MWEVLITIRTVITMEVTISLDTTPTKVVNTMIATTTVEIITTEDAMKTIEVRHCNVRGINSTAQMTMGKVTAAIATGGSFPKVIASEQI